MKRKIHIEAVKKAIDGMFSDRNPKNLILKNERKVVWVTQGIGTIDTRSETELSSLFERMFEAYQHKHPDNTRELFIEAEIDCAKEYQTYFPEYKTNSEHKTYYFELQRWIIFLNKAAKPTGESQQMSSNEKLKVKQIALIHVYEHKQITRENAGEIAAKYGYNAKYSGEGLFQDYATYCSPANRKGKPNPCTPRKLKNKIQLFESVVRYLSNNSKQRAIDELNILKTILETEFQ